MRELRVLHLASFDGNIGDNANHEGFYSHLERCRSFTFKIERLEIREFYWKRRFFDETFVETVNDYDLLIVGGGNYFELWVKDSPTGTSVAIEPKLLERIKTPILFNALGVDPGQGASEGNLRKFRRFLDLLFDRGDLVSVRNDGAMESLRRYVGERYANRIIHTVDAGFFVKPRKTDDYYEKRAYCAINLAADMADIRFASLPYTRYLEEWSLFVERFLKTHPAMEIVFVPHIYRDLAPINDLLAILPDRIRRRKTSVAPLLHGQGGLDAILGIYGGADLVLANRFHANVCAIGLGRPVIGLVNYRQIAELYRELGSESVVDISKEGFAQKIFEKISPLKSRSLDLKPSLERTYQSYMDEIFAWLKKRISD